jgi:hypothetical protein
VIAVPDHETEFRFMSGPERELLGALLSAEFPGKPELVEQAHAAMVRVVDEDGSLAFKLAAGPTASVIRRIPVEGDAPDDDGVIVHVLLHVVDGLLRELEVLREDGRPPRRPVRATELRVIVL